MAGEQRSSILIADDDPEAVADYRSILCPPKTGRAPDFANPSRIEDEVLGAALAHDAFPEFDLSVVDRGADAVGGVGRAVAERRPFTAAFIGVELRGGDRGLEAAEDIRALDPDIPIILVAARCELHPADVCARLPPADRLAILMKPFHAVEIQQHALSLAARRGAERAARAGAPMLRGLSRALSDLPAGFAQFDAGGRLVYANRWMHSAFEDADDSNPSGAFGLGRHGEPWPHVARSPLPVQDRARVAAERGAAMIALDDGRRVLELECKVPGGGVCRLYVDVTALAGRQAHVVPRIALRQAGSDRSTAGSRRESVAREASGTALPAVDNGTLDRHIVAAVDRIRTGSNGTGAATLDVVAPSGDWPARVDGAAFETALEGLLRNIAEATQPGGHIRVELGYARAGRRQGRRQIGRDAGDHIRVSVRFAVDAAPAASFARLGAGLDEVQAIAARAGGYVRLEVAKGSQATIAICLLRRPSDAMDRASTDADPAGSTEPRRSCDRGQPIRKEPAD